MLGFVKSAVAYKKDSRCAEKVQNIIGIFKNINGICRNISGICKNIIEILTFIGTLAGFSERCRWVRDEQQLSLGRTPVKSGVPNMGKSCGFQQFLD